MCVSRDRFVVLFVLIQTAVHTSRFCRTLHKQLFTQVGSAEHCTNSCSHISRLRQTMHILEFVLQFESFLGMFKNKCRHFRLRNCQFLPVSSVCTSLVNCLVFCA